MNCLMVMTTIRSKINIGFNISKLDRSNSIQIAYIVLFQFNIEQFFKNISLQTKMPQSKYLRIIDKEEINKNKDIYIGSSTFEYKTNYCD